MSDNSSSIPLGNLSSSRLGSNVPSVEQDLDTYPKITGITTFNILFLGETGIGKTSIIDLIAGQGGEEISPDGASGRTGHNDHDAREVTLDNKTFLLRASPSLELANGTVSAAAAKQLFQDLLPDLRKNGAPHLLVYCLNASHSTSWIEETHSNISSCFTLPSRVPVVAVVTGVRDLAQQESWWSKNNTLFTNQWPSFVGHAFIPMMSHNVQSPFGDRISESRRTLRALILENYADVSDSSDPENRSHKAPYKQRSIGNSLSALFGKPPPSSTSNKAKAIDVVLLGETGVGKSSVINLIAGATIAKVSPDSMTCTKTTARYTIEEKGRTFHLHDTPGLVDPSTGAEDYVDPIAKAQKLILSLNNGIGPDLLLFCVSKKGSMKALQRSYRLFCKIICRGKVPFALVITELGKEENADDWWKNHAATVQKYGIECSWHAGLRSVHARLGENADLDEESKESISSLLVACADRQSHSLRSSINRVVGQITCIFSSSMSERNLMRQCNLDEEVARKLAGCLATCK
ncbi:P-loop containing nucleoside triphosphate hydrolase protein [Gyrodon lividus]|nr:P-loop containing nucleoside triphosphate hydrolase protein [Gyrodon lividus]